MALSRKYKTLLMRAKVHPLMQKNLKKNIAIAKDLELVLIHDRVTNELKRRGIIDNE